MLCDIDVLKLFHFETFICCDCFMLCYIKVMKLLRYETLTLYVELLQYVMIC
jgi:hypothetical protein